MSVVLGQFRPCNLVFNRLRYSLSLRGVIPSDSDRSRTFQLRDRKWAAHKPTSFCPMGKDISAAVNHHSCRTCRDVRLCIRQILLGFLPPPAPLWPFTGRSPGHATPFGHKLVVLQAAHRCLSIGHYRLLACGTDIKERFETLGVEIVAVRSSDLEIEYVIRD